MDEHRDPTDRAPDVTLVVPTRHETANIDELLQRVRAHFAVTGRTYELLFVDDSDDETPEMIADRASAAQDIRLIHRGPDERDGGLAGALTRGFAEAHGRVLMVMDADLQHPPEVVETLVAPLLDGPIDVAVGSRYAAGGSAHGLDGYWRHWASVGSRRLIHLLFAETRRTSDPGGGLFAVRREVVSGVELTPIGYKMLVEVLVRGNWASIVDVPYRFDPRHAGTTNSTPVQGWRMVQHFVRLWGASRLGPTGRIRARIRHRRKGLSGKGGSGRGSAFA